jgi:hypothetical protein
MKQILPKKQRGCPKKQHELGYDTKVLAYLHEGDKTHVTTRLMGTRGYAAPEYIRTSKFKICSFYPCDNFKYILLSKP